MEEKQTENKAAAATKAAEGLWQALMYSTRHKKEYDIFLGRFKRFDQLEQIYICMVAGVPGEKALEMLETPDLSNKERADALERLWMEKCRRPQFPTEEQDRQIKGMDERVRKLGVDMAQIQADVSQIRTDQERRRKQTEGPFKPLPLTPGRGNPDLDSLEKRVAGLEAKIRAQDDEIARMKDGGTKVRGIILTAPEMEGAIRGRRRKKMLESEKEKIDRLLETGYASDQLDFLLQCRQDGISWDIIRCFDGKDIPVELMKKLKDYYTKNMPESGIQEEGGESHG